jgi:hypothetical protein
MSDLVERLRLVGQVRINASAGFPDFTGKLLCEAAERIEELEAQLNKPKPPEPPPPPDVLGVTINWREPPPRPPPMTTFGYHPRPFAAWLKGLFTRAALDKDAGQ